MLGGIACVGWDVAILDDGPVMLAGNWNPGVRAVQMTSGVPLGETAYARCLAEHLEARLASTDLAVLRRYSLWEPLGGPARDWSM